MLTKEERGAIAERIKSVDCVDEKTFYESIVGKCVPSTTSYTEDLKTIFRVVLDLCDTSNMIELPLDKDGQVIRIHDVVYDNTGMEREVSEFRFPFYGACIYARTDDDRSTFRPDELAHKKPVTIASLVKKLTDIVAADYGTPMVVKRKLSDIADQLEKLGGSDD